MTPRANDNTPPPVLLAGTRLLEYATADETITYTNKSLLYVDGKLLGRVANLAICESLDDPEMFLLYCDEHWDLLGLAAFDTIEESRRRAESEYHGITDKWIDAKCRRKMSNATSPSYIGTSVALSATEHHRRYEACSRPPQLASATNASSISFTICGTTTTIALPMTVRRND